MMRLKRCIVVSVYCLLTVVFCPPSSACGPMPLLLPDQCDLYRILPYYAELKEPDYGRVEANCRAWMRSSGCNDMAAVRQALYDFSLLDWQKVPQGDDRGNAFCRSVMRDDDVVRLLVWSKYYEQWSEQMRSPWYYGCGMDDGGLDIDSIVRQSMDMCQQGRYADRYLLLSLKCLYRSGRNDDCIALWKRCKGVLRGSHLRDHAEGYYAACLLRSGHREEALAIYVRLGDAASLQLLQEDKVAVFEQLLRHHPNSPFFPVALQRMLFVVENYSVDNSFTPYKLDSVQLLRMVKVAQRAGHDPRVRNQAMWRYTAACLLDYFGHRNEALAIVEDLASGDATLNASIRMLRLHLHAQLDPLDDAFERYLLRELQWVDNRMQAEFAALDSVERYCLTHFRGFGDNREIYRTVYVNDALRRIVLSAGGLADRFIAAGRQVRALQLCNMADNRFLQISGNPIVESCRRKSGDALYYQTVETDNSYSGWNPYVYTTDSTLSESSQSCGFFNEHDFSNRLFVRADAMKADLLTYYWHRVEKPRDWMDRWLNEHGYTDPDYWCDIIGTHMLREMRFSDAEQWLAKVDSSYQRRLNTAEYMVEDPFSYLVHECNPGNCYKLNFARRMASLERQASSAANPDDRADAMLTLSIALRNAFGHRCWPLVAYAYYVFDKLSDEWLEYRMGENPMADPYVMPGDWASYAVVHYSRRAHERAAALRKEAFATYVDPERKAQALRRVCEFTYLMQHLANTPTGQDIARRCDRWKDYLRKPSAS